MINYIKKDHERNLLVHQVYDARIKEFYEWGEYDLSLPMEDLAKLVFKRDNPVTRILRQRFINWRGLGNENELYLAFNEDELNEIFWEHDMTLMNGAVIKSRTSIRDKETIANEERSHYRHGYKDLH